MTDQGPGLAEFAERWQGEVRRAWDGLPRQTRDGLLAAVGWLPKELRGWRSLIDQAVEHVRLASGGKDRVAIVGPVNVGKSLLYNQMIRSPRDRAQVSAVPGTTRVAQSANAGIFAVIDTPGADALGPVGQTEKEAALAAARSCDLLITVFDASHGIGAPEKALFRELTALGKPAVVALNKIDLVPSAEQAQVLAKAAGALGLHVEQVLPISAKQASGIERVLLAVAKSEPAIVAALGAALPAYRWKLSQAVIARAASTAAAIALAPLPFIAFIPLIAVQSAMVLSIARIHAQRVTLARARELLFTFGLGLMGRTLFYELSKFAGIPGWLLAAAVAAGTTGALGYAVNAWFERGERVSRENMRRVSRAVSGTLIDRLRGFGRRRPRRAALRQSVIEALEEAPQTSLAASDPHSGLSRRGR